ncbi:MAG: ABC transporter ATP-binding protein [Actinobacteria bacterium]|nr:ABC transporter ATP-binding protein [Actinomycetota bacterium]
MKELALSCRSIHKRFNGTVALNGFDLDVRDAVLVALLGPSGCGKTTALRVIAGFERPDSGEVAVRERVVAARGTWVPPEKRRVGMVFQDWVLFPHLDVYDNVAFGLGSQGRRERVGEVLDMMRLSGLERRMPHELSGGQQQRVALARALAPSPEVVLLDEPFSNLDAALKAEVRMEVRAILHEAKATAIFVTHDQEEALAMADEMAVMDAGRILQVGTPHEVYQSPVDLRVASMVGDANLVPGDVTAGVATTALGRFPAADVPDGPIRMMVRPEEISIAPAADGIARIVDTEFYGHDQMVRARLDDGNLLEVRLLGPHPDLHVDATVDVTITGRPRFFAAASIH